MPSWRRSTSCRPSSRHWGCRPRLAWTASRCCQPWPAARRAFQHTPSVSSSTISAPFWWGGGSCWPPPVAGARSSTWRPTPWSARTLRPGAHRSTPVRAAPGRGAGHPRQGGSVPRRADRSAAFPGVQGQTRSRAATPAGGARVFRRSVTRMPTVAAVMASRRSREPQPRSPPSPARADSGASGKCGFPGIPSADRWRSPRGRGPPQGPARTRAAGSLPTRP